jgi:hypothetical protein
MEPPSLPARFGRLRQLFWLFLLLTVGYMIWAKSFLYPLHYDEIVQFEVAKTVDKASSILQNWKNTGKYEQVLNSTYTAFLFIFLYTTTIAVGCRFVSLCTGNEILIRGGQGFAWLIIGAAACDIAEIIAMSLTLHGHISTLTVLITYNLSRIKFSLVIVCLLFILTNALYWAIGKLAPDP